MARSKRFKRKKTLRALLFMLVAASIYLFLFPSKLPPELRKYRDKTAQETKAPEAAQDQDSTAQRSPSISFSPQHPSNFNEAKRHLKELFPHGREFYCACSYNLEERHVINFKSCGFQAASSRGHRIEWEHVVPASIFGRQFSAWTQGDPSCTRKRGRDCARQVSEVFRLMEADLYNLMPAIGELNKVRSNFAFGEVPGEVRKFGSCDFEVKSELVEPPPSIRGDIARIYFYMESRYPGFKIIDAAQVPMFEEWDRTDPLDSQEFAHIKAKERVQGNSFFIGRLSQKASQKQGF